jgi:hypothetical protein
MGEKWTPIYQACGLLRVKIYLDANNKYFGVLEQDSSQPIDLKIPKQIKKRLYKKFSFAELVNSNKSVTCGVYPKTGRDFKLKFCMLKDLYFDESEAPYELNTFKIKGQVSFIDFENQAVFIKIVPKSEKLNIFHIAIKYQDIAHELKGIKCKQYWSFDVKVVNNEFIIKSAQKNDDPKDLDKIINIAPSLSPIKNHKKASQQAPILELPIPTKQPEQTLPPERNRTMQVRSEVVVKINGALPEATPAPNKKVQV